MTTRARGFNRKILTWARVRAGVSTEALASLIHREVAEVDSWESGNGTPTFRQLEEIASKLRRPVAVFFFSVVPDEPDPDAEFRTLPAAEEVEAARDTRFAIRDAHARQIRILELAKGENPAGERYLLNALTRRSAPSAVREALGVTLEVQVSWRNDRAAFQEWRAALEAVGVFVFKRAFTQMAVSGFCVPHRVAPVIVVNNGTSWTRQTFTLFHELAHLLRDDYGVTRADPSYMDVLSIRDRRIEQVCNRFASECLVPPDDFSVRAASCDGTDGQIQELASHYHVSREVILRRLVDDGWVSATDYERRTALWSRQFFARREGRSGGGNYYATQASYLGQAYLGLAFASYRTGESTIAELSEHLGVKARSVEKLEEYAFRGRP